jgi:HlyD family secretion protein
VKPVLIACLLVLAGCGGDTGNVATAVAVRTDLVIVCTDTGEVTSRQPVLVAPHEGGRITWIVPEGTTVAVGDRLLELENADIQSKLDNTAIELEQRERALTTAQSELRLFDLEAGRTLADAERTLRFAILARQQYTEGRAPLRRQELDLAARRAAIERDQAVENATRMPDLLTKGFTTAAEVRTATLDAEEKTAQAERRTREQEIHRTYEDPMEQAKLDADVAGAEIALARVREQNTTQRGAKEGEVRRSEALLTRQRQAQTDHQRRADGLRLVAPAAGLVVYGDPNNRWNRERPAIGKEINRNATVMQIPDLTDMVVKVGVLQLFVNQVAIGQTVEVVVDGILGRTFHGAVTAVSPTAEEGDWRDDVKRYQVTIRLDDAAGVAFRDGMEARVTIRLAVLPQVIAVPISAVLVRGSQASVCLPGRPPQWRPVTIGRATLDQVEITAGLEPGQEILLFPADPGELGVAGGSATAATP